MSTRPEPALRRLVRAATVAAVVATVLVASPASANVPEGWSNPQDVSGLTWLLLLIGLPVVAILVITAMVYLPPVARGENVRPHASVLPESQWLGGPKSGVAELPAPDGPDSQAGGAGARW